MKKKASAAKQLDSQDSVRLKPVLGIRPGVYLTVLYSAVLVLIFFFLFFFPGIVNPRAVLFVKTEPAGAAVRINGVYMGTSGSRIIVPKGVHAIEALLPGFDTSSAVLEMKGRVFASLFFPRPYNLEFSLKIGSPQEVLSQAAYDYASWSFGGEPTESWQIPLSLSEGAYRAGPFYTEDMREILKAASRFTVTRAALRDLVRAKTLLDNRGISPSPLSLISSVSDMLAFLSDNPGSAQWLSELLVQEASSLIRSSDWYKNEIAQETAYRETLELGTESIDIAGLSFISVSSGEADYFISENPVSAALFEIFLNENPQWKSSYTDYFEEEIANYPSNYNRQTIAGITWHAASSFADWFTAKLPPSFSGMEAGLPTEAQWLLASGAGIIKPENPAWEWCADPFAPLQFIAVSAQAAQAVSSPEMSLRGRASAASPAARASLPAGLSSPFVTFRLVISDRE